MLDETLLRRKSFSCNFCRFFLFLGGVTDESLDFGVLSTSMGVRGIVVVGDLGSISTRRTIFLGLVGVLNTSSWRNSFFSSFIFPKN